MKIPFKVHSTSGSMFNKHTTRKLNEAHNRDTPSTSSCINTPAWTGWVDARVVICRNGRVGIIVRLQFGDRPPNLCSDRQETSHNDRWTSSVITPQNCHYTITLDCRLTPRKLKPSHRFIDPLGRCIWNGGKSHPVGLV